MYETLGFCWGREGSQKMSEQSLGEVGLPQGECHGNDETERLKQILTSWGMLVSDLGDEKKGEVSESPA